MVTTTTTMNNALNQTAANLHGRAAWVARAVVFVAAVFLVTMSATEHVSRAATSGESAMQRPEKRAAVTQPVGATAPQEKSATEATREAYQQRESSSKGVGDFAGGGNGIYIGGSTLVVVLLIVLLIVLI